jgi:hypothetical protein
MRGWGLENFLWKIMKILYYPGKSRGFGVESETHIKQLPVPHNH